MAQVIIYFGSIVAAAPAPVVPITWLPFQADLAPPVHDVVPSGFIPPQRPES